MELSDYFPLGALAAAVVVCTALWRGAHRDATWVVWTSAILMATVPVFDLHAHTHWVNVSINPFPMSPTKAFDVLANILLYLPFGFLAPFSQRRWRVTRVAGMALVLSLIAETSQLFSHSRVPSTTDLVSDVLGAVTGVLLAGSHSPRGSTTDVNPG